MIKDIIKNLKPSSTLRINEISKNLELEGKKVYKFGFGQSPFPIPEDVVNELKNSAHQNKYLPMQGLSELRTAICKYENKKKKRNFKEENVIVGPGTKELMFLLQTLFEGDILLPIPSWVSYAPQAMIAKNKAQTYVDSLGLKLGNLIYLNEISSPVATSNYAPRMEMAMSSDSQYTPSTFMPGDIEISISIQANFEISR